MLEAGADPNQECEDGWVPLQAALQHIECGAVALALIEAGTDVESTDEHGSTPLFAALREARVLFRYDDDARDTWYRVVAALLERGANPDAANRHGATPREWLEVAEDDHLTELVETLWKAPT